MRIRILYAGFAVAVATVAGVTQADDCSEYTVPNPGHCGHPEHVPAINRRFDDGCCAPSQMADHISPRWECNGESFGVDIHGFHYDPICDGYPC